MRRKSKIEKPRAANNAGPSSKLSIRFERLAELFSGLFYVAASRLNSPLLSTAIETLTCGGVNLPRRRGSRAFLFTNYDLPFTLLIDAARNLSRLVRPRHQRASRYYSTGLQTLRRNHRRDSHQFGQDTVLLNPGAERNSR